MADQPTSDTSVFQDLEEYSRRARNRDHTHKSPTEARRALRIGPIEGFLLWLAKTDFYVLSISTFHSRARLAGLGAMVVFTALLAFSTSLYTITTTLIGPDEPLRWVIGVFLACIYTFGIIMIDREIVGATTHAFGSMAVRVIFAVFIAIAVSYPAKLKFFEGRIDDEILIINKEQNAQNYQRIDELRTASVLERRTQLQNIQARIESANKEIAMFDKQIAEEQERGFCGPLCQGYIRQKDGKMAELQLTEEELYRATEQPDLSPARAEEIAKLDNLIETQSKNNFDILSKHQALNRILKEDPSARTVSYFLLAFFLLLELVPLALKLSLGSTEYHYYIEARNNINKQKIISISNYYVERMQANKEEALRVPAEITDYIAYRLEDESRPVDPPWTNEQNQPGNQASGRENVSPSADNHNDSPQRRTERRDPDTVPE